MVNENTHIPAVKWSTRKETIQCALKDCERCGGTGLVGITIRTDNGDFDADDQPCTDCNGITHLPVEVSVSESDTGILDLKAINTFGEPRENFDSLSTDIGEFFKKGHGDCPYSEFIGLFCNEF